MESQTATWLPAVVGLGIGLLAGLALGYLLGPRRQTALQRQLRQAREELAAYRRSVAGHFAETTRLLEELNLNYQAVCHHLGQGAEQLGKRPATPDLHQPGRKPALEMPAPAVRHALEDKPRFI